MTDLTFTATAIPADQLVRAAAIPKARVFARAALLGTGPWRGTTDLAVDAELVPRAAVPIAYALGWTAVAVEAPLGGRAARTVAERGRAGASAKDAGQVARAPAAVAVDTAAI